MGGATEKDWPKRPSDCQLPEAQKKTLIGPQLLRWRQSVFLHTWHCHGPCKPSSCTTFTLNSHWGRAATGKKKKVMSVCTGLLQSCPTLCDSVDCGLPGFSVREGVLQARILDPIGQYWLPYPSRALYLLLPSPNPLSTSCCQNPCDPSSCTTSTPGPHSSKPKPSRAASGAKPQWTTHM